VWQESAVLLDVTDSSAQWYDRLAAHVIPADFHLATLRLYEPVEAAQQRGLTRPTLSNQRGCGTGGRVDTDVIERDNAAEAM
jgi:hypothetical protein